MLKINPFLALPTSLALVVLSLGCLNQTPGYIDLCPVMVFQFFEAVETADANVGAVTTRRVSGIRMPAAGTGTLHPADSFFDPAQAAFFRASIGDDKITRALTGCEEFLSSETHACGCLLVGPSDRRLLKRTVVRLLVSYRQLTTSLDGCADGLSDCS